MTRSWDELVAAISEVVPLPLLLLALIFAAAVTGVLWYTFPAWLRLPRLRRRPRGARRRSHRRGWKWRGWKWLGWKWLGWKWLGWKWPKLRWRWRRRRKPKAEPIEPAEAPTETADELPALPAETFAARADRLAAEGRYAEAVRERLRAIVRDLIERGAIEHRPGWTVTELAAAAATTRPAVEPPLSAATGLFSDIWYGQRPAAGDDDRTMRAHAAGVAEALAERISA